MTPRSRTRTAWPSSAFSSVVPPQLRTPGGSLWGAVAALPAVVLTMVLAMGVTRCWGEESGAAAKPTSADPAANAALEAALKKLNLPGVVINLRERCVDVESSICLREGALELIACTKDTKEHESIIVVAAKPKHIHTALLLLGAQAGSPAMRKPIDDEGTRWIDLPPRGDPVDVYLVFKDQQGKLIEHPISDFIARSGEEAGEDGAGADEDPAGAGEVAKFPHTFLFAGSLLHGDGSGPRQYLSDLSGNVISISTFGDELLCLPGVYGQDNGALMWEINSTDLPALGSKVTLRLRPQVRPATQPGKPVPPPADRTTEKAPE